MGRVVSHVVDIVAPGRGGARRSDNVVLEDDLVCVIKPVSSVGVPCNGDAFLKMIVYKWPSRESIVNLQIRLRAITPYRSVDVWAQLEQLFPPPICPPPV